MQSSCVNSIRSAQLLFIEPKCGQTNENLLGMQELMVNADKHGH